MLVGKTSRLFSIHYGVTAPVDVSEEGEEPRFISGLESLLALSLDWNPKVMVEVQE